MSGLPKLSEMTPEELRDLRDELFNDARHYLRLSEDVHQFPVHSDREIFAKSALTSATLAQAVSAHSGWKVVSTLLQGVSSGLRGLRH